MQHLIARIWHGIVPTDKAEAYLTLMRDIALPDYKATQGNRGAWCLRRADGQFTHFEMFTIWEDIDAVKRFAGEAYEAAKYYDFDATYLTEMEANVRHYELYER